MREPIPCAVCQTANKQAGTNVDRRPIMSALWAGQAGAGQVRAGAPYILGCREAWAYVGRSEGANLADKRGKNLLDHRT